MSAFPESKLKSRWGPRSVHIGGFHAASSDEKFDLHLAALEYELSSPITIETKEDILSRKHWSERLEPFEHQVQNLITFCRRAPVALFADDVGLGKTISAGLVLNELQVRKKVRRALILCPKMLIQQWKEELVEKFGIQSGTGVGNDLNPWLNHQVPVVITTYESARDRMSAIRAASFDMIILDEAHKLRNLFGSQNSPLMAKAIHGALANRDFKYVLMLTATPIQNRLWDLYSLVDCLSIAKGHQNPLGSPAQFVERYVADGTVAARRLQHGTREEFRRKVQDYMVRTSRQSANLSFPKRNINPVQCNASPAERALQNLVGEALEKLNALARLSLAEALMSSPRALLSQVRRMNANGSLSAQIARQFETGVQAAGEGCKLAKLQEILKPFQKANPGKWRALVFTRRLDTLELIQEGLQAKGIAAGTIRGTGEASNLKSIKAFKADPPQANVLVSTDAGAVGLNLQVCNVVINFDLPWNPMVLEQRIGRVQRLGSRFQHIEVLNLTVKDSVEDHIVARLLSKLQVISETIGDIEGILEASDFSDNEKFEEELRSLVMRALMGHDVGAALGKTQESIRKAKEIYDKEREQVETTLGGLDEMHRAGPSVPKLKRVTPRLDVPTFCRRAFLADGASLQELPNQQIRVGPPGRAPWIATFDDKDPDLMRVGLGQFRGTTIQLYQEGSRAFEGLLGEWRKSHSHRVLDRLEESRSAIGPALQSWANSLGLELKLKDWKILSENAKFAGSLDIRATAAVSHDRYEKLCRIDRSHFADGKLPKPPPDASVIHERAVASFLPEAREQVRQAVEKDSDIREFVKFYDARAEEEVKRAGHTASQRNDVAKRFEVSLAAELVGVSGSAYLAVEVQARFCPPESAHHLQVRVHLVPLNGTILHEPMRQRCDLTKKSVPEDWLALCAVSKRRVLSFHLETSPLSKKCALPQFFGTCEVSGRRLLKQELGRSAASGVTTGLDLLQKSEVSDRFALPEEFVKCSFTGATALPDELFQSEISGRMARKDQLLSSAVSGKQGHSSEFSKCDETNAAILPDEGDFSVISNRFVSKDLLLPSDKNPERRGLRSEIVKCSVTSATLLVDEAEKSAVSGLWIDKDRAVYSGVSSRPARPEETVTCAVTGAILLPDEVGKSAVSGLSVDARLLKPSGISGDLALEQEMDLCSFSGKRILRTEGCASDVSGKFGRLDQMVRSAISQSRGHSSEFIRCSVSGDFLLPEEAARSDFSGRDVRPDLLRLSEKAPGRKGVDTEFETCAVTGHRLLRDEVEKSSVSGKLVDSDLLIASEAGSGKGTADEMVTCEETGARLLPGETELCSITGKNVDRRVLVKSELSGRMAIPSNAARCQFTHSLVLSDELEPSAVSGSFCRVDELEASELSGLRAHSTELVSCAVSGQRLIPAETGRSAMSDRIARLDLLVTSEKVPGRLGLPDEFAVCRTSGKRMLADEIVKSEYSGCVVDKDLAVRSSVSGRVGAPEDLIICEESGVTLFPDETEVCQITGKRVNRALVSVSEITGVRGLAKLLKICPETRKSAFGNELVSCAVSGLHVAPSEVGTCAVTGEPVLLRHMVRCEVTGRFLRRDQAVVSEKSGRVGHPDISQLCTWSGRRMLKDEMRTCETTKLDFDSDFIGEFSTARPILELLSAGSPIGIPPQSEQLQAVLGKANLKPKALALVKSPFNGTLAYFLETGGFLGFRKRQALGFVRTEDAYALLHPPCQGQIASGAWLPLEE